MNINSKDIKRYVYLKLGKRETEEINEEELNKITFLNLNYKNFKDEINEYDFNELKQFKNLKELTLNGFEITDEIIEKINLIPNLEILIINHSSINATKELINNLKMLVVTYTNANDLKNFKMYETLENLKMISCENVNINELIKFKSLKEISINSSNIVNADTLNKFELLKILNIDGSKIDSENLLIRKNVEFSHEEKFFLIG